MRRAARALFVSMMLTCPALARDPDGRFLHSPLRGWFDQLKSSSGEICCAVADGIVDPEWRSADGGYQVKIDDIWENVPDSAVVKEPNRFGRTMVWVRRINGRALVRCFLVGTLG